MSSRVLGSDTEDARESLIATDPVDDAVAIINGSQNLDNFNLFKRSVIATTTSSSFSNTIINCILVEGVNYLSIRPLGGMLHFDNFCHSRG